MIVLTESIRQEQVAQVPNPRSRKEQTYPAFVGRAGLVTDGYTQHLREKARICGKCIWGNVLAASDVQSLPSPQHFLTHASAVLHVAAPKIVAPCKRKWCRMADTCVCRGMKAAAAKCTAKPSKVRRLTKHVSLDVQVASPWIIASCGRSYMCHGSVCMYVWRQQRRA